MAFQRVHQSKSYSPQVSSNSLKMPPRSSPAQEATLPPTQEDIENKAFQQSNDEAFRLQIRKEYGTITPAEQERLGILQGRISSFWAQRIERAETQPNLLEILTSNAPAAQATEPAVSIQPKLNIGQSDDQYEKDADRVAEQVVQMANPQIQLSCSCSGESLKWQTASGEQGLQRLQTKHVQPGAVGLTEAPPSVHEVLRSPGQPLDSATRAFMEPRFGYDFSSVRVHLGGAAEQSAQAVNARAYTVGQHIVFGEGQFALGNREGRRLLAHELAHTIQQSSGAPLAIARAPKKPSFVVNQQDIVYLRNTMLRFYNLLSPDERASLYRHTTVAIALVTHDNEPHLVYTVASNTTNPGIKAAMNQLGITRWDPEGVPKIAGEHHAEPLILEGSAKAEFQVHHIVVTRKPCRDCGPLLDTKGIPIEWVPDPSQVSKPRRTRTRSERQTYRLAQSQESPKPATKARTEASLEPGGEADSKFEPKRSAGTASPATSTEVLKGRVRAGIESDKTSGKGAIKFQTINISDYPPDKQGPVTRFFIDRPVLAQLSVAGASISTQYLKGKAFDHIQAHFASAIHNARQEFELTFPDRSRLLAKTEVTQTRKAYQTALAALRAPRVKRDLLLALAAFSAPEQLEEAIGTAKRLGSTHRIRGNDIQNFLRASDAYIKAVGLVENMVHEYLKTQPGLSAIAQDLFARAAVLRSLSMDLTDLVWELAPLAVFPGAGDAILDIYSAVAIFAALAYSLGEFGADVQQRHQEYRHLLNELNQEIGKVSYEVLKWE